MTAGVGVLGTKGRAEGVDVAKGGGEQLPLELARAAEAARPRNSKVAVIFQLFMDVTPRINT